MTSEDPDGSNRFPFREEQVVDPDAFNRSQRFKEIHEARQRVSEFLSTMEIPKEGGGRYLLMESTRLAHLVSLYIMELEPLIIMSGIDDSELLPDKLEIQSLLEFASRMGLKSGENNKERTPSPQEVMYYFSAANRFYAQVGMDLELAEEESGAGFSYSDIVEEGPPEGRLPETEGVDGD